MLPGGNTGLALTSVLSLLLGACTSVGPDFTEPEVQVQSNWIETDSALVDSGAALDPRWWQVAFGDPVLNKLTEDALQKILPLRSAGVRLMVL